MISIAVQAPRSDTRFGSNKARPTWSGSYHENMPYHSQHYDGGHDAYGSAASGLPGTTRMPTSESSSAGRPTLPPLSSLLPNRAASRNASRHSPARMDSPELTSSSDKSAALEHLRRSPSAKTPKLDEQAAMRPPQQYQPQSHRWHAQDATNARDDSDGDVSRRASVNNILQAPASRSPPVAQSDSDYRRSAYSSSTSHESSSIRTSQLRAERDHALPPLTSLNILSPRKDLPASPRLQHAQHSRATPSSHDGEGGGQHTYQQQPVRQHSFSISSSSHASTSPMEARRHTALFPSHAAYPEQSRPSLHPPPVDSASGHARRRWSDDAPNDVDTQDSYEMEIFDRLCDLLMYVKEQNDQHDLARSPSNARSAPAMPLVRKGDFIGVSTLIRREIDVLHNRDPHLARSLADDEFALLEQQKQHRMSSMSSASVAPQNSRFGPERTGRRSTYTLGSGASLAPSSALRGPLSRYDYHNSHSRGSLPPFVHRNDVGTLPYPYQAAGGYGASHRGSYGSDYYDQRHDARNFERGMPRYPLHEDELLHHHPQYAGQQHLLGANAMPRRVRKRRDEADQSCLSCAATETPEWRKGPTGPRTLCNACGLLFAKQCRKRELDAQARGERPKGGRALAPEDMTADEKERSLIELQMAVHARTGQTTGLPATMMPSAVSGLPGRH